MKFVTKTRLLPILVLSCSAYANANVQSDDPAIETQRVFASADTQQKLRTILSAKDYDNFVSNLKDYSVAFQTKSGATYYQATNGDNASSVLLVGSNGLYYIAYKLADSNQITYITNDAKCGEKPHDAIKVFAHSFGAKDSIVMNPSLSQEQGNHECSQVYGNATVARLGTGIIMYSVENQAQKNARKVAENLWGTEVKGWEMNEQLAISLGKVVNEIQNCSASFKLVPKPPRYGSIPGLSYFASYGVKAFNYVAGVNKDKAYKTCISGVKYRWGGDVRAKGLNL